MLTRIFTKRDTMQGERDARSMRRSAADNRPAHCV